MLHGFHDHDLLGRGIDAQLGEAVAAQTLRALAVDDHRYSLDLQRRGIADRAHALALAAELDAHTLLDLEHLGARIDRWAGLRPELTAETDVELGAFADLEGEFYRAGIPDHADGGVLHLAVEQCLQDEGRVRRGPAAGIVRHVGQHHGLGQVVRGHARHRRLERNVGRLGGLAHGEEFPAELARQALGLGPIAIGDGDQLAAHLLDVGPRKAVGDRERQHPSLPSIADSLSTKPRIGWRVVWNTPIMRQSQAAITGLVRPSMAPSITVNRSSARSGTSTCGYSLNSTSAVASRKVPSPMLQ